MIIPNEAYVVFYEAVLKAFIKLLPEKMRPKSEKDKVNVWKKIKPDPNDRRAYFDIYFHKFTKVHYKHFYNRYNAALTGIKNKKESKQLTKYTIHQFEKDNFLEYVLVDFLKISYPTKIKESEIDNQALSVAILFQVFLEINGADALDLHPTLRVYDRISGNLFLVIGNEVASNINNIPQNEGTVDVHGLNEVEVETGVLEANITVNEYLKISQTKEDFEFERRIPKISENEDLEIKQTAVHWEEASKSKSSGPLEDENENSFIEFVNHYLNLLKVRDYNSLQSCWDKSNLGSFRYDFYDIPEKPFDLTISITNFRNIEDVGTIYARAHIDLLEPIDNTMEQKTSIISPLAQAFLETSAGGTVRGFKEILLFNKGRYSNIHIFLDARKEGIGDWKITGVKNAICSIVNPNIDMLQLKYAF